MSRALTETTPPSDHQHGDHQPVRAGLEPVSRGGRGVLEGAFELLDALSRAQRGAGLSELAREAGLPKATTHRLLEQLVELGAVQRDGPRYFVGVAVARIGRSWQPNPPLRRAAHGPARSLARLTGGAVAVCVLEDSVMRVVDATAALSESMHRMSTDDELVTHTAAGQVLLAAGPDRDPPRGFTGPEWTRLRIALSGHGAVALDHQDILPGVFCAAAPVPLGPGGPVASMSVLFVDRPPPKDLPELVRRAARETVRQLARRAR